MSCKHMYSPVRIEATSQLPCGCTGKTLALALKLHPRSSFGFFLDLSGLAFTSQQTQRHAIEAADFKAGRCPLETGIVDKKRGNAPDTETQRP